jgi:hypothetical protein
MSHAYMQQPDENPDSSLNSSGPRSNNVRSKITAHASFQFEVPDPEENNGSDTGDNGRPRKGRLSSGRYAMPKKVIADLDSDDNLIVYMKSNGYNDAQVVDRFFREGRVRYDKKTIASRYARILRVQEARKDKELKAGLIEWSADDVIHFHLH